VKLTADNGGIKAEEVYFDRKLPKAIGGAVLVGDFLYGTGDKLTQFVDLKTGEVKWTKERSVSPASILYADGRLYLHGEDNGDLQLLDASPDGFRELGHFTPPNIPERGKEKAWAYPVISDGRLYVHDWGTLWCYDVKGQVGNRAASRTSAATTPRQN
jgi:outer membrane protein assembly factor BamB